MDKRKTARIASLFLVGTMLCGATLFTACAKEDKSANVADVSPEAGQEGLGGQGKLEEYGGQGQSGGGAILPSAEGTPLPSDQTVTAWPPQQSDTQGGQNAQDAQDGQGVQSGQDVQGGQDGQTGQGVQSGQDGQTGQGVQDAEGGQDAQSTQNGQVTYNAEKVLAPTTSDAVPITETYFPDAAFREYLSKYVDKDKDGKLSQNERGAVKGLGSVECEGGLSDGRYSSADNIERGEKLRAIKSLEGIEYFQDLKKISFVGGYTLEKISICHPDLESVYLGISTLRDFSIEYAPKLRYLCYVMPEKQDIVWWQLEELSELEISAAELALEDLAKCRNLTSLSLYNCVVTMPENGEALDFPRLNRMIFRICSLRIPESLQTISFSGIPYLETFHYSEPRNQEIVPLREIDFGENEYLKEVIFGEQKIAERIVLNDIDKSFSAGAGWTDCEVVFAQELALDTAQPLPEGSIWLTAENFPDAVFRQYLYTYVDTDRDHILTKKERSNLRALDVWDQNSSFSMTEQREMKELLKNICCFDGIEYLEDLRRFCLDNESAAVSIHLDNPSLLELRLPEGLKEFSIKHAEGLQDLTFYSKWGMELDLSGMKSLRKVWLENISADFSYLLQNQYLTKMYLEECESLGGTREMYDFSCLKYLSNVNITPKEGAQLWAECMCFGDTGYFDTDPMNWDWIRIGEGVTKKVILESKNVHCSAAVDEVVYLDDVPGEDVKELPEGSIWNGTENIADENFRCYLYQEIDKDRDNILTLKEREELTRFVDTGYDYNYGPGDEINEYKWKIEDDFLPYVYGITSVEGFEYFPNLKELQLEKMSLSKDVRTIVVSNPELEVLDLRFNGNVETIDLTACKKLRVCVIDSTRDKDFVQEVKPTVLLPEHLQLETIEGMDCVVGKGAQERYIRKK